MNNRTAGTGGSGATYSARLNITDTIDWWVIPPGTGIQDGGSAGIKKAGQEDLIIKAFGGGAPSGGSTFGLGAGLGGSIFTSFIPSVSLVSLYDRINGNNGNFQEMGSGYVNCTGAASSCGGSLSGYGASQSLDGWPQTKTGNQGYLRIVPVYTPIRMIFEISNDNGTTWQTASEFTLDSTTINNRSFEAPAGFNRARLRIDDTSNTNYASHIEFKSIKIATPQTGDTSENIRFAKFIFNNNQKYLLILSANSIVIYKDDQIEARVTATGLLDTYIPTLSFSQKEDTMIFTHPDMPPKQLQRTLSGDNVVWTWGNFELKNIPYYAFGGETSTQKSVSITPSDDEGGVTLTAASDVFTSDMEGQYIEGGGGRFKITEYQSATKVSGYTIIPFYTTDAISSWTYISGYEPAFSASRGWPSRAMFAQQRLFFGGSKSRPATIFGSRVNLYNDFKNAGNYDNDSIVADLLTVNPIQHLVYNRGIQIYTAGEEWSVPEGNLTPDKFTATINTQNGSYPLVNPVISDGYVLFVEKNGKSLLSYFYDYNQAAYTTDELSLLSNLILSPVGMDIEINSAKDKGDFLYIVLSDGTMLVYTLSLNQNVKALSKFTTHGSIKDVCCLGGETYLLVKHGSLYYIEKLSSSQTDCQMDVHIVQDTPQDTSARVEGLYQYALQDVRVWNDNKDYGLYHVDGLGRFDMPTAPNEQCHIGMPFDCTYLSNFIEINNQSNAIKKRIARAVISTQDTKSLKLNGVLKHTQEDVTNFFSVGSYNRQCQFKIESTFNPVNVKSISLFINYGGFI